MEDDIEEKVKLIILHKSILLHLSIKICSTLLPNSAVYLEIMQWKERKEEICAIDPLRRV